MSAGAAAAGPGPTLWMMLPAYNEAENLGALLRDFRTTLDAWPGAPPFRVVVVDDGSRDDTAAVAARPHGLDVTVVPHGVNRGLGAAMKTGRWCGAAGLMAGCSIRRLGTRRGLRSW